MGAEPDDQPPILPAPKPAVPLPLPLPSPGLVEPELSLPSPVLAGPELSLPSPALVEPELSLPSPGLVGPELSLPSPALVGPNCRCRVPAWSGPNCRCRVPALVGPELSLPSPGLVEPELSLPSPALAGPELSLPSPGLVGPELSLPSPGLVGPELPLADHDANLSMPTSPPAIDSGLPISPADADAGRPEFVPPVLLSVAAPKAALLIGRGLMSVAMLLVGLAAWRGSTASGVGSGDVFWSVAGSAGVFVAVALAGLVFWSMTLAANARRLSARGATPRSIGWSWLLVVAWVAVSSLTYLRVDGGSDFDPFPGLAGIGFALCLGVAYSRLHSVFRGLTRMPPKLVLLAYPLDLAAFGLVWWRLTSWPDPVARGDADHVRLTAYIAFGAAVALAINALVFVSLARQGGTAMIERTGRLRARAAAVRVPLTSRPEW